MSAKFIQYEQVAIIEARILNKHLDLVWFTAYCSCLSTLAMDRIFYKSDEVDAYTGHPIYIFDTSYLPSTSQIDYDLFIPTMTKSLPNQPYILVMFSCGLNKINWVWGVKFLKAFLSPDHENRDNVKNLTKVISVHESWFVKSISQILTNISFSRPTLSRLGLLFDTKTSRNSILTSCDSLSDLSYYVDITKLKISLNIYKHDANSTLSPKIDFQCPVTKIITADTRFCRKTNPVFYHHFYQIFRIVDTYGPNVELIFHRPGNRLSTEILVLCITRNQLIWINDWDLNCIASCFKKLLLDVSGPLIPVDKIALPMNDLLNYTLEVLNVMMIEEETNELIFQIMDLCHRIVENSQVTNHTYLSISKSMCHALTHELLSTLNKDRITIGTRFIKNVISHWNQIRPLYVQRFQTVDQIVEGKSLRNAAIDELYNMSYEITMKEEDSGDEQEISRDSSHELIDTKAILADLHDVPEVEARPESFEVPIIQRRKPDPSGSRMPNMESLREVMPKASQAGSLRSKPKVTVEHAIRHVAEPRKPPIPDRQEAESTEEKQDSLESKNPTTLLRDSPEIVDAPLEVNDARLKERRVESKDRSESVPVKIASGEQKEVEKRVAEKTKAEPKAEVQLQFPPQKYKFEKPTVVAERQPVETSETETKAAFKKPVIRGRRVGQLTKLFEDRAQAIEIIRTI